MIASLDGVSKAFADQQVLLDVSAKIHEKDRIGLIGRNGAGKSTLVRVLLGQEQPDDGEIYVRDGARIGYMRQDSGLEARGSIIAEMRSVFSGLLAAQQRMDQLAREIETNPENEALHKSYDRAMSEFLAEDGYNVDVKIRRVLNGMGFADRTDDLIETMSGGEKTRLALAKLLLQEPELLVLDEPTNHLDMRTLRWLEEYLSEYKGAILVVSHDRFFLDRITTATWELEDGILDTYRGSYSTYRTLRDAKKKEQLREYEKQQVQIAELRDYVARNMARASTAAMARSRQKQLDKLERVSKPRMHAPAPHFHFEAAKRPWTEVLHVDGLDLQVGDEKQTIVQDVCFDVRRGERLAVIGANGAGKSTLLRALLSGAEREDTHVTWGRGAEQGYYEQENRNLRPDASVMSEVIRCVPGTRDEEARGLLGAILLTGDDVFRRVQDLSGGERAKLGLAILMGGQANVLLLDEPTNHLDLPAREALEDALRSYDGTLIFVSHDRYFVNALSDRLLVLDSGCADIVDGNYDTYLESLAQAEKEQADPEERNTAGGGGAGRGQRRARAQYRAQLRALEQEIAALESEESELRLTIESSPSDYEVLQAACDRLKEVTQQQDDVMERWVRLADGE